MTIGQKIFYLLEERNMTQKEFSLRTGISTTTISDWRKKNTNPGSDKIMAICAALGVTPEYLYPELLKIVIEEGILIIWLYLRERKKEN